MRNIPNIITSVRLICALIMAIATIAAQDHATSCFLPLFVAAGVSDMLDGFIARRFNWCTDFGATLDSISDLSLYVAVALFLTLNAAPALASCSILLLYGAAMQSFHLWLSYKRFHQFPAYHTDYTRVCAYAIFLGIASFHLTGDAQVLPYLACLWISCSIEGIIITLLLPEALSNLRGIREVALLRATASIKH